MPEIVTPDQIIPLRHAVLRPGQAIGGIVFTEDDGPDTIHLAERAADGTVIGCATFFPERFPETVPGATDAPAWRLRGMATMPEHQGQGVGGRVLEAGVEEIRRRGGTLVWCNGRSSATPFYLSHGFVIHGEEFEIASVGPHFVLARAL